MTTGGNVEGENSVRIKLGVISKTTTTFSGPSWPTVRARPPLLGHLIHGPLGTPVEVTKSGDSLLNLAGAHESVVT